MINLNITTIEGRVNSIRKVIDDGGTRTSALILLWSFTKNQLIEDTEFINLLDFIERYLNR